MNNQKTIDETLQPYVEKALEGIEKGAEFAIDMAPELLKEFYAWHMYSHIFFIGLCIALLIASRWGYNAINKDRKQERLEWDDSPAYVFGAAICFTVVASCAIVGLFINLYKLTYLLVAPKLYLIDYFLN